MLARLHDVRSDRLLKHHGTAHWPSPDNPSLPSSAEPALRLIAPCAPADGADHKEFDKSVVIKAYVEDAVTAIGKVLASAKAELTDKGDATCEALAEASDAGAPVAAPEAA